MPPSSHLAGLLNEKATRAAERGFVDYVRQAWPVLEPAKEYLHNWHIEAIADYLEAVTRGDITRLLINIPPRYMKSICVTVLWPTWVWLRRPSARWLFTSYAEPLATMHSLDRRRVIDSEWYQSRWSDRFKLTSDQNVKTEYENSERGRMFAFGFGGSVTGKGGDYLVVDDPHNPKKAESDAERKTARDIFQRTLSTRLDDKKKGGIVVVMQRLHEEDISQLCIDQGYEHLKLPAVAEERTVISTPSGRTITREPGDILWPEREGAREIAIAKVALGSYGYAGQYGQDPAPTEGGMLKRHWWRFWHYKGQPLPPVVVRLAGGELRTCPCAPLPEQFDTQLQSWDMTFKDTKASDFVAGQVWGAKGADLFMLDYLLERLDFVKTIEALLAMTARWPNAAGKLIEDKANGPAVISTLRNRVAGLIAVEPQGGKSARVSAVSPIVEAGNVFLPHPSIAGWVDGFINNAAKFPNAAHDDDVDTFTQAVLRLQTGGFLAERIIASI